jgi:cytochrome c peroxidase
MHRRFSLVALASLLACASSGPSPEQVEQIQQQAQALFQPLPAAVVNPANALTPARTDLGRQLYFDLRLSKNHDVSCNSCHGLSNFGVDGQPTSLGHRGQRGGRNSPSVYNAALHLAQFWDGRARDVEEQAKGPVLNPIEMAMPSEAATVAVLKSIPGYESAFAAAFPGEKDPITYQNMANAIGAFERRLLTPSRFDEFLRGDEGALSAKEVEGLQEFMNTGCITCHNGAAIGGSMYRKLGQVKPYAAQDVGRYAVTKEEADRHVFKVPSLRNVAKTGPYFHDGSIATLEQAIRVMGEHQLGIALDDARVARIRAFLESLTGTIDSNYTAVPVLPKSGAKTPKPDPT